MTVKLCPWYETQVATDSQQPDWVPCEIVLQDGHPIRRHFIYDSAAVNLAVDRVMEAHSDRQKVYIILPEAAGEAGVVDALEDRMKQESKICPDYQHHRTIVFAVGTATRTKCEESDMLCNTVALDEDAAANMPGAGN